MLHMKKLILLIFLSIIVTAFAADPNEPASPVRHPTSRRVKIDYSPEALAARREAARIAREKSAAEQKARREKILAERARRKPPPPAVKKPAFGRPYFLFAGIMMLAIAGVIAVYGKLFNK